MLLLGLIKAVAAISPVSSSTV